MALSGSPSQYQTPSGVFLISIEYVIFMATARWC
jgi:hypothetical protein